MTGPTLRPALLGLTILASATCATVGRGGGDTGSSAGEAAPAVIREQAEVPPPQVASDPSFREARGQIIPGAPEFPAYPGATLVGSAERNKPAERNEGYVIKWTTADSVSLVMAWYQKMLPQLGWKYTPPSDGATVEQTAIVEKGNLRGTLDAEADKGVTEIILTVGPRR
jgi:hypothetical protein